MKYFKTVIKFPHENVVSYNTFALKRMPYVFLHWQGWQMHRLCYKYWHVETLSLNPQANMNMGDTVSCTYIHIPGWQTEMQVKKKEIFGTRVWSLFPTFPSGPKTIISHPVPFVLWVFPSEDQGNQPSSLSLSTSPLYIISPRPVSSVSFRGSANIIIGML